MTEKFQSVYSAVFVALYEEVRYHALYRFTGGTLCIELQMKI